MNFLKKIFAQIKKSLLDHTGKTSSSTISSYIVLSFIVLNCLVFMAIELVNAIIMWKSGSIYTVPQEHIWIFGLILSHHLGLLFYKKKEYNGLNEFTKNSKETIKDLKENVGEKKEENEEG